MSIRLYVGNLPKNDVEREELQVVFADAGELVSLKVIKDRKTGKCRGFGFVTVETEEQADQIVEKYNGAMFQDMPIKIEKALPKAKEDEEDGAEPATPKEPRDIPKPTLSINKVAATPVTSNAPAPTRRPAGSGGNSGGGNSGGGNSGGGGKKGARKESNKANSGTPTTYTSAPSTESFQPDPRWAGKLAELKDKLAQSGNA